MNASRVIERMMEACGVNNRADLARALDIDPPGIYGTIKKGTIPPAWFLKISEQYNVSIDWLYYGEGSKHLDKNANSLPASGPSFEFYDFALVPLAAPRLNAGGGAVVSREDALMHLSFRKQWLHQVGTSIENLVLLTVEGDSMFPTVATGDTTLIDLGRREIVPGGVFAIGYDDLLMVKRLEPLPAGQVRVISDNRTEYEPYTADLKNLRIIGRVIWIARELVRSR